MAAVGSYRVEGSRIAYENQDGALLNGEFVDGLLRQGEKIFYKVN